MFELFLNFVPVIGISQHYFCMLSEVGKQGRRRCFSKSELILDLFFKTEVHAGSLHNLYNNMFIS